jgi:non-heme chloroperoxidase
MATSKTIVMIHGMFGHGGFWANYRPFFERRGFEVLTPTLRMHEDRYRDHPPSELGTVSMRDYADELAELIGALPSPPILVGHSMGGLLALMLAGRGLAERAALLCPVTPYGIDNSSLMGASVLMNVLRAPRLETKPVKLSYRGALKGGLEVLKPEQRRKTYALLGFDSGRALSEMVFWKRDEARTTRVEPSDVTCPLLIVAAGRDTMVPVRGQQEMARMYGRVATYREFPEHTHLVLAGPGWRKVAQGVYDWLVSESESGTG